MTSPVSLRGESYRKFKTVQWDSYWSRKAKEWTGEKHIYLGKYPGASVWVAGEKKYVKLPDGFIHECIIPFTHIADENGPLHIGAHNVPDFLRARRKPTEEELASLEYEQARAQAKREQQDLRELIDVLMEDRKYFAREAEEAGVDKSREHGNRKHFYSGCLLQG